MRMQTFIAGGSNADQWLHAVGDHDVRANDGLVIGRSEVGIWTTVP